MTNMSTATLEDQPLLDPSLLSDQDKRELMLSDSASITSSTTLGTSDLSFIPAKSLHINTRGISIIRLPVPPSQLETTVHDSDGTVVYKSTRAKRNSGSCVLADADGTERISTTYYFGPGKDPVLNCEAGAIRTVSKWTSRTQTFLLPDARTFTWSYKREKGFGANGMKGTALVLMLGEKRLAALIRNDETRTPGSRSCNAGHGGELVLAEAVGGKDGVGEDLVVATCLLMLKKEVDLRRTMQILVPTGVVV